MTAPKRATLAEKQEHHLAKLAEPVLIERNGRPMAVLVDIDQYLEMKRKARVETKESPFSS